jgi:hypothetical protein
MITFNEQSGGCIVARLHTPTCVQILGSITARPVSGPRRWLPAMVTQWGPDRYHYEITTHTGDTATCETYTAAQEHFRHLGQALRAELCREEGAA